jgi:hypothetical protein
VCANADAQFRDAIESLSPEQQRFAKAYRAMQASHYRPCARRIPTIHAFYLSFRLSLSLCAFIKTNE